MKKLNAKKIIAGTVISMGLVIPLTATNNGALLSQPQTVQAATKKKKITLQHNAYLYNYRGRRVGRRKLYRHHTYTYYSIKRIHGKKYYRVGKNSYIKASNVLTKKHTNKAKTPSNLIPETNSKLSLNTSGLGTPKFQVSIDKTNADIFSASHATANGSWIGTLKLDGTYNVYAEENDMYEIGNGQWIKSGIAVVISNNSTQIKQNTINNAFQSSTSSTRDNTQKENNNSNVSISKRDIIVNNLTSAQKQEVITYFVQMINAERAKNGLNPLKLDESFSAEAQQRAIHDGTTLVNTGDEDSHEDENGNSLVPTDAGGEVEAGIMVYPNDTPKDLARFAYKQFMENDADQNWAHRKNLLGSWTTIGVGVYFAKGTNNFNLGSLVADLK